MRVLVVEDDAALAELVVETLCDDGHTAVHLTTLEQACAQAASGAWDAFVLDAFGSSFEEPDEGYRATIRTLAACGPVVLTTGRAWARSFEPADLGAAAILSKPYDLDELLATLEAVEVASACQATPAATATAGVSPDCCAVAL